MHTINKRIPKAAADKKQQAVQEKFDKDAVFELMPRGGYLGPAKSAKNETGPIRKHESRQVREDQHSAQ